MYKAMNHNSNCYLPFRIDCMDFYFVLFPFWKSSFQVQKASTSLFCCLLYIWMLISLYYGYSNVDFILLSCEGWH
ncbi:hypothetical protein RchiOBHm_Chr1g0313951 [Rosa chinensis]|uniref:Uncharacterized protein n=1 Tax=Rosa chinensis TaxID=74649 RepID=A0A2P6S718_ROSCH|nr:hypothetical protein RchiOBHm_Chr1g0313951 [Rosa chinensis]